MSSSFEDAVLRLNSRNLPFLMRLCSYLSALEVFAPDGSPIFPLWDFEKARLLCEAVLASKAANYKTATFTHQDLRYVINAANDALYDPRLEQEVQSGRPRPEMLYKLQCFFSRMANIQLRHQEHRLFMGLGRMLGILEVLPKSSSEEYPAEYRDLVSTLPEEIKGVLGGSIFSHFVICRNVWLRYQIISEKAFKLLEENPPPPPDRIETSIQKQARYFSQLVDLFSRFETVMQFEFADLRSSAHESVSSESISAFFRIFSRDTQTLRGLAKQKVYGLGPVGWRLSPFERFPVVDLGNGGAYCIPNIRTFIRSITDIIHFTLQDALGQRYNIFRGISQEVYLRKLVEDRLVLRQAIPERRYRKKGGEFGGPDLTLVEEPAPRLIVVESKGKRLLAKTRFTMAEDAFDRNYEVAYEALGKLPSKIDDLVVGIDAYSEEQADIGATLVSAPFAVIVVGEAAYMMTELLRYRAMYEDSHPLYDYPYPFCIMGPQTFELAVEHAFQECRPLYEILDEFWEDSENLEPSGHMAESFRGRSLEEWPTFAASFLKPLVEEIGLKTNEATV